MEESPKNQGAFSERLERLFKTRLKPDGSGYSNEEVSRGTDYSVTAVYIWKLRTGRARNPGLKVISALARFFKVEPNYFFSDEITYQQEKEFTSQIREIALRASYLDDAGQQALRDMLNYIEHIRSSDQSDEGNKGDQQHPAKTESL